MLSEAEIFQHLSGFLQDLFEVPEADITPDALLYEDLDLDSIDAVDLVVQLQELTDRKIPPEEFKAVRTVQDVITAVHKLLKD